MSGWVRCILLLMCFGLLYLPTCPLVVNGVVLWLLYENVSLTSSWQITENLTYTKTTCKVWVSCKWDTRLLRITSTNQKPLIFLFVCLFFEAVFQRTRVDHEIDPILTTRMVICWAIKVEGTLAVFYHCSKMKVSKSHIPSSWLVMVDGNYLKRNGPQTPMSLLF